MVVFSAGLLLPSRVARVALLSARLSALMTRLMRVLMEWALRAAGFAMIGEALVGAMREAMAGAFDQALE